MKREKDELGFEFEEEQFDLLAYLHNLWRYKILILVCAFLGLFGAFVFIILKKPLYQVFSTVLVIRH